MSSNRSENMKYLKFLQNLTQKLKFDPYNTSPEKVYEPVFKRWERIPVFVIAVISEYYGANLSAVVGKYLGYREKVIERCLRK